MDIVVRRAGPDPVVAVTGEVDFSTAPQLRKAILDLLAEQPPQRIRVDLAEVSFLDSTGVFVLIDTFNQSKERGVAFHVEHPRHMVRRILEVCGILDLLTKD